MTATDPRPSELSAREPSNCFDALRLIAALCVVVQHAVAHLDSGFMWYREGSQWWFADGVMAFFLISGGMVYSSAERCYAAGRPMRDYLRNRALRIVPALYAYTAAILVLLFVLGVISPGAALSKQFSAWVLSNLFLVPVYHPSMFGDFGVGVVNGSLWTIPIEFGFYLIVPPLLCLSRRVGTKAMVAALFLAGVGGVILLGLLGGEESELMAAHILVASPLPWLGYFALGIAAIRIWKRVPQHPLFAAAVLISYLAVCMMREHVGGEGAGVLAVFSAVPLTYVVFWIGHRGPRFLRTLTERVGDLSFGAYIWHMPIVNLFLWFGLQAHLPAATHVPLVIVATLVMAYGSWNLVESPALRLKRYSRRI